MSQIEKICFVKTFRETFPLIRFTDDVDNVIARLEDERTPPKDEHDKQVK